MSRTSDADADADVALCQYPRPESAEKDSNLPATTKALRAARVRLRPIVFISIVSDLVRFANLPL